MKTHSKRSKLTVMPAAVPAPKEDGAAAIRELGELMGRLALVEYQNLLCRIDRLKLRGVTVPPDLIKAIERGALSALRAADWLAA